MKKLLFIIIAFSFTSCLVTRNITESYLKNQIEKHDVGQYSSMKILCLSVNSDLLLQAYLEIVAYKYKDEKKLIIASDRYKLEEGMLFFKPYYASLSVDQCEVILGKIEKIMERQKDAKFIKYEVVYLDYTVSDDVFISIAKGRFNKSALYNIDIWIKGRRHTVTINKFVRSLKKFINY